MRKIKTNVLPFFMFSLILLIAVEVVQRGDFFAWFEWVFIYPGEFFVSLFLFMGFLGMLWAFSGSLRFSFFIVFTIALLLALVSNLKQQFLGEPLLPWDFVLGRETTDIINYFGDFINAKVIFLVIFLVFLGLFLFKLGSWSKKKQQISFNYKKGLIVLLVVIVLSGSVCFNRPFPLQNYLKLQCLAWDQKTNAERNGLLLSFCLNLQWISVQEPEGYKAERIGEIGEKIVPRVGEAKVKPHIIVVMSEAFWDPCLLPGITYSQDPLPFFHRLQKEATSGTLLVPVYGGATVNTEFEVLTGHSAQFLPGGSIAYAQYVRKPVDSLASILTRQGYHALAIHSYHNWFYRRDQVFRNLGFAKFISSEFFVKPELRRYYISDAELSRLIIKEVEAQEDPAFVFAVSMQNHGPYGVGYPEGSEIKVTGELSADAHYFLETYAQGARDADRALQMLVEHFQEKKEPTIIVFFGDHLPALGEDYQIYRQTGYFQEDYSYEEYERMHTVPFIMWSNYLTPEKDVKLNASFLSAYLLQRAGLPGSLYTDYLGALAQEIAYVPMQAYYEPAGIAENALEDYRLLQYDLLFGENYLGQGEQPLICQENYFLGRKEMSITEVNFWENDSWSEGELEIKGENFIPRVQVYVQNKPLVTRFVDETSLKALVPMKMFKKLSQGSVEVRLVDSLGNIIAAANCTKLKEMLK